MSVWLVPSYERYVRMIDTYKILDQGERRKRKKGRRRRRRRRRKRMILT